MNKIYKCFISSTFKDLKDERRKVFESILDSHNLPVGMENFNAASESQWAYIERMLQDCDYFIVIVAHNYGSIMNEGISYTERETNYAIQKGIPVLAFIINSDVTNWPHERYGKEEQKGALDNFKEKLKTRMARFWVNGDDLARQVSSALNEVIRTHPRPGFVHGKAFETAEAKIEELKREIVTLQRRSYGTGELPKFNISFEGEQQGKLLFSLRELNRSACLPYLQSLSPLPLRVPYPLQNVLKLEEIANWNYNLDQLNRKIAAYNEKLATYNQDCTAFPLPFKIINNSTVSATDVHVELAFPAGFRLYEEGFKAEVPQNLIIPLDPIQRAKIKLTQIQKLSPRTNPFIDANIFTGIPFDDVNKVLGDPIDITISPPSLLGLATIKSGYYLSTVEGNYACYHAAKIGHRSVCMCNTLLVALPPESMEGEIQVEIVCEGMPEPQRLTISIEVSK